MWTMFLHFTMDKISPLTRTAPSVGRSVRPSKYNVPWLSESLHHKQVLDAFSKFAQLSRVTDRLTHCAMGSTCIMYRLHDARCVHSRRNSSWNYSFFVNSCLMLGGCGDGGTVGPVGVAPTRTVGASASIIFPCSIKIQKTEGGETQPEHSTALC